MHSFLFDFQACMSSFIYALILISAGVLFKKMFAPFRDERIASSSLSRSERDSSKDISDPSLMLQASSVSYCTSLYKVYRHLLRTLTFLSCVVMFIPSLISATFFCILLFLVRCMCLQHYVFSSTSIDNKRTWHMRIHKGNTIFLITLIVLCRIFQPDHRMYMGVSPCAGILPGRSSLLFIKENNSCKIVNSNFQKSKNSTFVTFWPVIAMYSR